MAAERLDLAAMVGDLDLPCEASPRWHHTDAPATWVVWPVRCCADRPTVVLSCDDCLRKALTRHRTVRCQFCGHRTLVRLTISRFERLDKPPAVA